MLTYGKAIFDWAVKKRKIEKEKLCVQNSAVVLLTDQG